MKLSTCLALLVYSTLSFGQEALKPRPSPLAMVSARYKDTYLKITYSQPNKRGREVFGKLVPYGQVWRTGANEATEITFTRDLKVNGVEVKAGTYSLFTIPGKENWTVILNADLGLWGAYNYNEKTDVLRFNTPNVLITDMVYESFTIWMDQKNEKGELVMAWDKSKVSVPVQFLEPKL
jgi:hypothetical protein